MTNFSEIFIKKKKDTPFRYGHPWVFSGAIEKIVGEPKDGDQVNILSSDGAFIGYGLYNSKSSIAVRLYSRLKESPVTIEFILNKIDVAINFRKSIYKDKIETGAIRLFNSEGDALSGLVIDRFAGALVVQFNSYALSLFQNEIADHLMKLEGITDLIIKSDDSFAKLEGYIVEQRRVCGSNSKITVVENGLLYTVDLEAGQKTGFYCDQRENRLIVSGLSDKKKVLDLFCYSGGFGLNALKGDASSVDFVDSSAPALHLAEQNLKLNKFQNAQFLKSDSIKFLQQISQGDYDLIIVDPPKYAVGSESVDRAAKTYISLNSLALSKLQRGGILVSNSCSGRISQERFMDIIKYSANASGKSVQIFHTGLQPLDHPFVVPCFETRYLKSVYMRVL